MNPGILSYNWGVGGVPRLMVTLNSLRKFYSGTLGVAVPEHDTDLEKWQEMLEPLDVQVHRYHLPESHRDPVNLRVHSKLWIAKAAIFDPLVIYEQDFLFQGDPTPVFEICKNVQFGQARYHDITGIAEAEKRWWAEFPQKEFVIEPQVKVHNHGCFYIRQGEFLREWERCTTEWRRWVRGTGCSSMGEERIASIVMNRERDAQGILWEEIPQTYNLGARHGSQEQVNKAVGIHYLSRRHVKLVRRSDAQVRWYREFDEVLARFPKYRELLIGWDPKIHERYVSKP